VAWFYSAWSFLTYRPVPVQRNPDTFSFCYVASYAKRHNGIETESPSAIVSQSSKSAAATPFYGKSITPTLSDSQPTCGEAIPTEDSQLAYNCLTSVLRDAAAATNMATSVLPYLQ